MFLDTSGLLTAVFSGEPGHARAIDLIARPVRMLTTDYVFAELVALAQARKYSRDPVLACIRQLRVHPLVTVVWGNEILYDHAELLLNARPDKAYSLCDAVSFVLMKDFGVVDALTKDHHFEQEGFVRLLDP